MRSPAQYRPSEISHVPSDDHFAAVQIDWSSEGGNGRRLTRSSLTPRISSRTIVPSVQGHPVPKERKYDTTPPRPRQPPRPPELARKGLPRQNANSAPAANPMRNRYTPYICSEQISVIENLLPRRWTADDIAVRADGDLIRQLASGGQIKSDAE